MINFIGRKFAHHARHSGYDRLLDFIPDSRQVNPPALPGLMQGLINSRVFHGLTWRVAGVHNYTPWEFLTEVAAMRLALREPGQIFHFIYGENTYRFAAALRRLLRADARLICTFHQPSPSFFRILSRSHKHLRELDAVVILGHNQREMLSPYVDDERIFFVPYSSDTDFFCPPQVHKPDGDIPTIITVGNWLRDFDTLRQVIQRINADQTAVRFIVVTLPANFQHIRDCIGVECKSGIDDFTLRDLYQLADVLLLPLKDCVANTSLLEGIACGLPAVVTDVGGVRDYVDESCAVFTPLGDAEAMLSAVTTLLAQPDKRRRMGIRARQRALEINWTKTASMMMEIYRQVTLS